MTKKILIAEDNKQILKMYRRIFPDLVNKYEVSLTFVTDGKSLVDTLLEDGKDYVLVITDNDMPWVNGLEAIKRIREAGNNIPICMVSGDHNKNEALEAGANEFYQKPVSLKVLEDIVSRYLQ